MHKSSMLAMALLAVLAGTAPAAAQWEAEGGPDRSCHDACQGGRPEMTPYGDPICYVRFRRQNWPGSNVWDYDDWGWAWACRIRDGGRELTLFEPYACSCLRWDDDDEWEDYKGSRRYQKRPRTP
jgi:hypothetical protein